jgi:hypothetical protein
MESSLLSPLRVTVKEIPFRRYFMISPKCHYYYLVQVSLQSSHMVEILLCAALRPDAPTLPSKTVRRVSSY